MNQQGGMMRFIGNDELDKMAKLEAEARQQIPVVQELAGYIRKCYDAADDNHEELRRRMLKCLRQRMGEYDPDVLAKLEAQGGVQVFMQLTETKCRAAEAWLRDILLSANDLPWDIAATPVADLAPAEMEQVGYLIQQQLAQLLPVFGPEAQNPMQMAEIQELVVRKIKSRRQAEADEKIGGMREVMRDQIKEGCLASALDDYISDLVTYPFAVLKGPVVQMKPALAWAPGMNGEMEAQVGDKLTMRFERVSPFDFFFETGIEDVRDGYVIQRHTLTRADVAAMKGQPGYDDGAVSLVLEEYEYGMLDSWLDSDYQQWERERLEGKRALFMVKEPSRTFKALEFWGSVSGRMLQDWGIEEEVDPDQEYEVSAWLIGRHVVRAVLNADPLAEKPYHVNTYARVPGSLVGKSLPELMADVQSMCNAAARAVVNNMLVASGPQVEVSTDRLPPGEELTEIYPWKIWQTLSDPSGTTAPAVRFNQPNMNAESLMVVYEKFTRMADEQSGIPSYTYGDTDIQGAGRTSSGLAMLMGSAGKGIRQIVTSIDMKLLQPILQQLYRWNMRYNPDPAIKGDAQVIAKGTAMIVKEQLNMRRVEFLQITANPIDAELLGLKGRAALLREVARGLEMDVDTMIPSDDELDIRQKIMTMQGQTMSQQAQPGAQGPQGGAQAPQPAPGRPAGATMDQGARVA